MAGMREVRCVGPSYQLADRQAGVQRTVNMYLSAVEGVGEDKQFILRSCPGASSGGLYTGLAGNHVPRGMIASLDGAKIYYVYEDLLGAFDAVTQVVEPVFSGSLLTTTGHVQMAHGNGVIVMADGANGYIADLSSQAITRITDPDWLGSFDVEFLDGYFIFVRPNSEQFYISAIDDASNIDALDFSSSDRLPDELVTARVSKQRIYLFGQRSTEIWINTGGADFPFTRYTSAAIDVGIVGRRAVVRTADDLAFVGLTERGQAMVYLMTDSPRRISTRAVEESLLASHVDLSTCKMWAYQTAGAEFIGVEADGMRTTWVYEVATQQWHERCRITKRMSDAHTVADDDGEFTRMRIEDVVTANGRHYAAFDMNDGNGFGVIYALDETSNAWVTERLVRERTWPHLVAPNAEPVRYASLELMCSTGNRDLPLDSDGFVTLECSNDGGRNWGSPLIRSLGSVGRYDHRVRWLMLGQARDRVFRIRCASEVPFNIHRAQLEAS